MMSYHSDEQYSIFYVNTRVGDVDENGRVMFGERARQGHRYLYLRDLRIKDGWKCDYTSHGFTESSYVDKLEAIEALNAKALEMSDNPKNLELDPAEIDVLYRVQLD